MIIRLNTLDCHKMNFFGRVSSTQILEFMKKSRQINRNRFDEECSFRVKSISLLPQLRVDSTPTPTTIEIPNRQKII
uniref:Uncharacterized protein n=1 Tax=Echinococcus canadensis TaxID=519352 RepID=A0A915EW68_9CEST